MLLDPPSFHLTADKPLTHELGVDLTPDISATFDADVDWASFTADTFFAGPVLERCFWGFTDIEAVLTGVAGVRRKPAHRRAPHLYQPGGPI